MLINHVCITAKNMEESLEFYRDVLGMTVILDEMHSSPDLSRAVYEDNATIRMVILTDDNNAMLELIEWQSPKAIEKPTEHLRFRSTGLCEICFSVPDLQKLKDDLEAKGFEVRTPIWDFETMGVKTPVFHMLDPDGVQVELIQA